MAKSRKRRKRRTTRPQPTPPKPRAAPEPVARRTARDQRPQAPWGSFPLTELTILVGLVILVLGFANGGGPRSIVMIAVGMTLAALGGLEISVREHFAGYRSHSVLLALACAMLAAALVGALIVLAFGEVVLAIPVAAGVIAFLPALLALRGAFRRASGGLSFRVGRLRG